MEPIARRRTDRVTIELPIVVMGLDATGSTFLIQGQTTVVGRHGAKIVLQRKLTPHQEILVRCMPTAREADARVIGQVGVNPDGSICYGVELLDADVNIWDIEFPSADDADSAVGRVLLECARCRMRELVYLNEIETEVLEANRALSRQCKRCVDLSVWKETRLKADEELPGVAAQAVVAIPSAPPRRTRDSRRHARIELKTRACIRHSKYGEDVVETVNVSRGGFRFKSRKYYREGWTVEAALPYHPSGANIFAGARIVYAAEVPGEGMSVYGAMYIPRKLGKPDR